MHIKDVVGLAADPDKVKLKMNLLTVISPFVNYIEYAVDALVIQLTLDLSPFHS
jgi:hypothetical protein